MAINFSASFRFVISSSLLACLSISVSLHSATDLSFRGDYSAESTQPELAEILVFDSLIRSGQESALSARVVQRNNKTFRSAAGLTLEFQVDGTSIAHVQSDRSGAARAVFSSKDVGEHVIGVRLLVNELLHGPTGYAVLSVLSSTRSVLLIDFDGAVCRGSAEKVRPAEGSASQLKLLSETFQLVYLTQRDVSELSQIRRWSFEWKLPQAPVVFWNPLGRTPKNPDWRTPQLARWMSEWKNVSAGISGGDEVRRAFRANGLKSVQGDRWKGIQRQIESE